MLEERKFAMNENYSESSDNRTDFAASFLRRLDHATSVAKPLALSDAPQLTPSLEPQFHDPERWDGLS
jgi:hypothetical protein